MDYSPKKMGDLLSKNNFNFKKNYGQNFIVDENIINNIIIKSEINECSTVVEIGAGAGSLTYKLAKTAKEVIAFEIDERLKDVLESNLNDLKNVELIFGDFLTHDIGKVLKNKENLCVVANLPYYITTPIITKFIDEQIDVKKMVLMVQKEVGDRFRAKPGTKDYNSLTIFLNYYFDIIKIMDVSRNVFMPKPNVDSIVIALNKKENRYQLKNEEFFFKLVRASFKQKRKTISNNLKEYDLVTVAEVLKKHNLTLMTRAEQIPLDIFVEMANALYVK